MMRKVLYILIIAMLMVMGYGTCRQVMRTSGAERLQFSAYSCWRVAMCDSIDRALSNRLLSGTCIRGISAITGKDFFESFTWYLRLIFMAYPVAVFAMMRRSGSCLRLSAIGGVAMCGVLLIVQCQYWWMAWDSLDVLFMLALGYGAVAGKGVIWLLCLFLLSLMNRESALFIPAYICLSAIPIPFKWRCIKWMKIVYGWVMMVAGVATICIMRYVVYSGATHKWEAYGGNQSRGFVHIEWLLSPEGGFYALLLLIVLGVLLYRKMWHIAIMYSFLCFCAVVFGGQDESRVYFTPLAFACIPCLTNNMKEK